MGDYKVADVDRDLKNNKLIYGDAIQHYKEYANGQSALVFCVSVNHCYTAASEFEDAGIPSEAIDGSLDDAERTKIINKFRQGEIKCLMSCELINEGFDCPAATCAFLLRPTQSLTVHLQQLGRVLRPLPGKSVALIFDHVNNCEHLGPPWIDRFWTLEGYPKGPKNDSLTGVNLKLCGWCGRYVPSADRVCKNCQYKFVGVGRDEKPKTIVPTKLVRLTPDQALERERQKMARRSKEELIQYAVEQGWDDPEGWAEKANAKNKEEDHIYFHGDEVALVMLFTKRGLDDPRGEAKRVLAKRAEYYANNPKAKIYGTFEEVLAAVQLFEKDRDTGKPLSGDAAKKYARAIFRNGRLKSVFDSGTKEQLLEAASMIGIEDGKREAYVATILKGRSNVDVDIQTVTTVTPPAGTTPTTETPKRLSFDDLVAVAVKNGISDKQDPDGLSPAQKFALSLLSKQTVSV
jgi:superfamily II DNA/RNA helicase